MISVIIPTFNGERFIERALKSVIHQSYGDLEIIVVDDGSRDRTKEAILQIKDNRIRYFYQENKGGGEARNLGIKNANGDLIAFLDDDDYWIDADKLKKQVNFFEANREHVLIGISKAKIVNEENELISDYSYPKEDNQIRKKMLLKNCFMTSGVLFKKDAFLRAGGFKNITRLAEDYDLWMRMGIIGKMANIDSEVAYTLRKSSTGSKKKLKLILNVFKIVLKNRSNYPNFLPAFILLFIKILYYSIFGFLPPFAIASKIKKLFRI